MGELEHEEETRTEHWLALTVSDAFRDLLCDDDIEEIWLNRPDQVFAARGGQSFLTGVVFDCDALAWLVSQLLLPTGRRLDALSPFVDATLPDGSRLHVVAGGIAGPHMALNIRKFPSRHWSLDELQSRGFCSKQQHDYLVQAMSAGQTIVVSGATHTGKTTLLRALLVLLPPHARVVTCEEVFELRPQRLDVASLQTRPASLEGGGAITLRDLVVQALRMRPDLLVIGEVRQAEAFDLLLALNSGIAGLGTIHASSAFGAARKLALLSLLAGTNVTSEFVFPTVAECIDVIVHLERSPHGGRHIADICEVDLLGQELCVKSVLGPRRSMKAA